MDAILSSGASGDEENGGFYTFGGEWSAQSNTGIKWVTSFTDKETSNVSRLKHLRISNDQNLLVYEVWTLDTYQYTCFMLCDDDGTVLKEKQLEMNLRVQKSDDMILLDGKAVIVRGY